MTSLGIFYGSTDGNTARVAHLVADAFAARYGATLEIETLDIAEFYVEDMADFDLVIVGIPTWNHGQLRLIGKTHWRSSTGWTCTTHAVFGLGDQAGYPPRLWMPCSSWPTNCAAAVHNSSARGPAPATVSPTRGRWKTGASSG
ncbi:MAG: flavodoxin domain-containing protein [Caldilineaceae bacterium]